MTRKRWSTLTVGIVLAVCGAGTAHGRSVDVVFDDRTITVDVFRIEGTEYVSLPQLLDAFDAETDIDTTVQRLRAVLDGRIWTFWAHSSMVGIDGEAAHLGHQVRIKNGAPVAPLPALVDLLDHFSGMRVIQRGRNLYIRNRPTYLNGYHIESKRNGVFIEMEMTAVPPHEAFVSEGNWINVTLHKTRLNPAHLNARRPDRAVRRVVANQFDSSAQISFRMREPVDKYVITTSDSPPRLMLLVGDSAAVRAMAVVMPPPDMPGTPHGGTTIVVIDAGHGGPDSGMVGMEHGTAEKDVALDIARRLARLFRKNRRYRVVMTREEDRFVPRAERIAIANNAGGDLFLSIHTASDENTAMQGCRTFFLGHPNTDGAVLTAANENAASHQTLRLRYQQLSVELAQGIQQAMESKLDIPGRGIDQTDSEILNAVEMPSVLIQVAFMTNPREERLLRKRSFRRKAAAAIYQGVLAFRRAIQSP